MMRQVVLDTETTGLYPEKGHRIIEIGAVELVNRKLTNRHFHVYINPLREIEEEAVAVHGITNEFLQDKPTFDAILPDFLEFIKGAELVIHNAPFDLGFLNHELKLQGIKKRIQEYLSGVVDTLALAREIHSGQKNNLDALCKRYNVDLSKREFHGALLDANLLVHVYLGLTGGQEDFFGMMETEPVTFAKTGALDEAGESVSVFKLPVLMATEEECMEHEKYMKMLVL